MNLTKHVLRPAFGLLVALSILIIVTPMYADQQPVPSTPTPTTEANVAQEANSFLPIMLTSSSDTTPAPVPSSIPVPSITPPTTPPASGEPVTLLASYVLRPYPAYEQAQYTPRAFTAEPYAGWDQLSLPGQAINDGINTTLSNADWLTLRLNRPATLAIVWRGQLAPPAWMSAWSRAADVTFDGDTYPTYQQTFPSGEVTLGAVNDPGVGTSQPTYLVLFAEEDGTPSPEPSVPAGQEMPAPNQPCPAWVHDQYVTTGPDGNSYPTWHPQIDPVYWCSFEHEHGSDPSLFIPGYKPAYGYTSTVAGMDEPHVGFKTYVFDDEQGQMWAITHHFGTAGLKRACVRFHSVDIAVANKATGELIADIHLMGDFGKSVVNSTTEPLTPADCPDQASLADADESLGLRMIPVETRDAIGYEPWRLDDTGNILGLSGAALTFNTPSAMVICDDLACDEPVITGASGAFRFFSFDTGFGIKAGENTDTFYTDPYGKVLFNEEQPGTVRQYVKPGTDISLTRDNDQKEFYPTDPWGALFICSVDSPIDSNVNIEGAIQLPN